MLYKVLIIGIPSLWLESFTSPVAYVLEVLFRVLIFSLV